MYSEKTKQIRKIIKDQFGFNNRQVGVKCDGSYHITIKDLKAYKLIKEIEKEVSKYENIHTDNATGEILCGGNTFVFVESSWEWKRDTIAPYREEVKELVNKALEENGKEFEYKGLRFFMKQDRPYVINIVRGVRDSIVNVDRVDFGEFILQALIKEAE